MEERVWVPNNQFQAVSLKGGLSRSLRVIFPEKKKKKKKKEKKNMKKLDISHPEFTFSLEFYCNWNHIVLYVI